jgi:hypothetical protein
MHRVFNYRIQFRIYTLLGVLGRKDFKERKGTKKDDRLWPQGWSIFPLTAIGPECTHSSLLLEGKEEWEATNHSPCTT